MNYLFNPDVCPSSLGENDEPITEGETAHKWDGVECNECGAKRDAIKCPLCQSYAVFYHNENDTHLWVCDVCPYIGMEYYIPDDITNLNTYTSRI